MRSKIREELYKEDLKIAACLPPQEKLKQALELSQLCLELKKAVEEHASKKNT